MDIITQHPAIASIAAYFLFSSIVGGMPAPTAAAGGYTWLYNSLHLLAGNISTVIASKYPQLPSGAVQVTEARTTTVVPDASKQ